METDPTLALRLAEQAMLKNEDTALLKEAIKIYSKNFFLLTGSQDKTARLWSIKGNMEMEYKGQDAEVTTVAFSPDGKTILITGDNDARLWDASPIHLFIRTCNIEPLSAV